jgi:NACHT domain
MAGMGKSTIARTIAREFRDKDRLGASFFFSRGSGDLGNARRFFTTLSRQLANMSSSLRHYICEAIAKDDDIFQQGLSNQWKHLILRPLLRLEPGQLQHPNLLLVIDALDECDSQDDVRLILHLLAEAKALKSMRLRIFVTSRPELPIRHGFRDIPAQVHQDFILHDISQSVVEQDIKFFFQDNLGRIQREHNLPADWPCEQHITCLVGRACRLFIYAATVCRFIGESRFPEQRLIQILQGSDTNREPERNLDLIYTQILRDSVDRDSDEREKAVWLELFHHTVGSIVVSFDLLSINTLCKLISVEQRQIEVVLRYLHSVLDVPEKQNSHIRLLHPSFRDFLLDSQRCQDMQFWVDKRIAHENLYTRCMQLMSTCLRRNIYGLKSPGELASSVESSVLIQYLPGHVQYACRYWVGHLSRLKDHLWEGGEPFERSKVIKFLQEDFLHWLEALSLLGKMSEGILMVIDLQSIFTVSGPLI